ncbi:unnamed protein product [Prorocentrum cordatum]|uniref:Uncharacterized protein n=1 Tax=Prorocentrum cordatum TaxID=2364126 RepID=A0ABN9V4X8_9DINO|nr:unnamed protein product [Polarella glacialis]
MTAHSWWGRGRRSSAPSGGASVRIVLTPHVGETARRSCSRRRRESYQTAWRGRELARSNQPRTSPHPQDRNAQGDHNPRDVPPDAEGVLEVGTAARRCQTQGSRQTSSRYRSQAGIPGRATLFVRRLPPPFRRQEPPSLCLHRAPVEGAVRCQRHAPSGERPPTSWPAGALEGAAPPRARACLRARRPRAAARCPTGRRQRAATSPRGPAACRPAGQTLAEPSPQASRRPPPHAASGVRGLLGDRALKLTEEEPREKGARVILESPIRPMRPDCAP